MERQPSAKTPSEADLNDLQRAENEGLPPGPVLPLESSRVVVKSPLRVSIPSSLLREEGKESN